MQKAASPVARSCVFSSWPWAWSPRSPGADRFAPPRPSARPSGSSPGSMPREPGPRRRRRCRPRSRPSQPAWTATRTASPTWTTPVRQRRVRRRTAGALPPGRRPRPTRTRTGSSGTWTGARWSPRTWMASWMTTAARIRTTIRIRSATIATSVPTCPAHPRWMAARIRTRTGSSGTWTSARWSPRTRTASRMTTAARIWTTTGTACSTPTTPGCGSFDNSQDLGGGVYLPSCTT